MSALALRTLAVVLMLLDHIGYCTGDPLLRIVGRLSMPVFAFLIANGFRYTRSLPRYALRLAVCALLSEFPYDLLFNGGRIRFLTWGRYLPHPLLDNIFFTFLLGLCFLTLHRFYKQHFMRFAPLCSGVTLVALAYAAAFVSADYGTLGVLWVALFGIFDVQKSKDRLPLCIGAMLLAFWRFLCKTVLSALGITCTVPILSAFVFSGAVQFMDQIQIFAALALFPILCYNGKSGMPKAPAAKAALQYGFYLFYPLHILILWWLL